MELRKGGQGVWEGRGPGGGGQGQVEATDLAFINNTNAWFLGGSLSFCFPRRVPQARLRFALQATFPQSPLGREDPFHGWGN